jgi:hypothetical protein
MKRLRARLVRPGVRTGDFHHSGAASSCPQEEVRQGEGFGKGQRMDEMKGATRHESAALVVSSDVFHSCFLFSSSFSFFFSSS